MKLFIKEVGRVDLIRHIEQAAGFEAVSAIALLEARSAVYRRLRLGELSSDEVSISLKELGEFEVDLSVVTIDLTVIGSAASLLERHALRSLDALQLASARTLQSQVGSETKVLFIACDRRLLAAAALEGFTVWNPEDQSTAPPPDIFPVN